jgi:hypothetical protein
MTRSPIQRTLAAALALAVATTSPAFAAVYQIAVDPVDGTFTPRYIEVQKNDSIEWTGLGRTDAIARIAATGSPVDPTDVCFANNATDPAYANPYRLSFDPGRLNEFTGPERRGLSGIWALGPEGESVSMVEIPSPEAEAITPGITAADGCDELDHPENDIVLYEDPDDPLLPTGVLRHRYELGDFHRGENPNDSIDGNAIDPDGAAHVLCEAVTRKCDASGCRPIDPDPADPDTIPPGTYLNGLLASTYTNPDVTGVVLRFNWKYLQYDDDGTIRERWDHLDRELERAIAHGKLVTLDVRAGMLGTPDWIFDDYLEPGSEHAAPWCTQPGCAFVAAHPSAGLVEPLDFVDHYDEVPPGDGCGSPVRIGAPGDLHYRELYTDFIARLAAHVASDSRWFQAVAHVKASGANLRTSEAELPHHCDDDYTNTADHQDDPKSSDYQSADGDRVLDVFKTLDGDVRKTAECQCNTQVWFEAGYVPQHIYDHYAEVESQIVGSFFGRKSIGYQLLQDGFPRANADGGGFFGDHLYRELLEPSSVLVNPDPDEQGDVIVNAGYAQEDACAVPSTNADGNPELFEDRPNHFIEYCSTDLAMWPDGASDHVFLGVMPLEPDPAFPLMAAYPDAGGGRFPASSEQSETILDQGGNGRFGNPASQTFTDRIAGKLFVPQHSGLQPLAQERLDLDYSDVDSDGCQQQLNTIDAAAAGLSPLVGEYVAGFPIPEISDVSTLQEAKGCPNSWIVDQGKDEDSVTFTISLPPAPPIQFTINYPPQLTGFQTSNKVRDIPHVESALFNLTYNTNAVFIELYEDAIWRIAISKGTGPDAAPLDDPDPDLALRDGPGNVCDQFGADPSADLCYSKNLSQWAEELHMRRWIAASVWGNYQGIAYPALADPYADSYRVKFRNNTGSAKLFSYINPSRCDPTKVDLGNPLTGPGALGVIKVLP